MDRVVWELIRASGISAVILLTVAVSMGISVNVRALDSLMKRAWVNEAHQFVALLAVVFTLSHLVLVVANRHVPISLGESLIPLSSSWRPSALALGTMSLYLSSLLVLSSYFKALIGHRAWRLIHYAGFAGWGAAIAHGLTAGSDTGLVWMQYLYLLAFAAVMFLTVFRILAPTRTARQVESVSLASR